MHHTIESVVTVMQNKGFPVFKNQRFPYNLNIVGERKTKEPNKFDDVLYVFWYYNHRTFYRIYSITTDPGTYWLKHPMNSKGTAILKEGHHNGLWQLGYHKGKYRALVQRAACEVYRDNNKNEVLDFKVSTQKGVFGINMHRASAWQPISILVNKWSAGCQVHADKKKYDEFIMLCEQAAKYWGNKFSYTLLLEEWFNG
jgi:hypothetical protein